MPDLLDENGLQVKNLNDLITEQENAYKNIFGTDVILEANSPDGQMIGITSQANADLREMLVDVYNSFDPDSVYGVVQDSRYKINGIERLGGTYTVQPIDITVNKTVTLQGLDANYSDPNATAYAVKDSSGNTFYLADTTTLTSGTTSCVFRAQEIGIVKTVVGTITEQVTPIAGVISVNNSSSATSIGVEQETDEAFQIRRAQSTAKLGQGNTATLLSSLLELEGVNDARVYNYDWTAYPNTDSNGVSPHFIWAIVEGGTNSAIGEVLYTHCGGAGMKGSISVNVPAPNGQTFVAKFDRSVAVPLYIKMDLQETVAGTIYDISGLKTYIANNLNYVIGELAETSKITEVASNGLLQLANSGAIVNVQISTNNTTWVSYIACPTVQSQFTVDATRIAITEINLNPPTT